MTKRKRQVVMEFDQAEVMCILLEELGGAARPQGMTAAEALGVAAIIGKSQEEVDRMRVTLEKASARIIDYMTAEMARQLPGSSLVMVGAGTETRQ